MVMPGWLAVLLGLTVASSPWVWMSCRRSTATSSWGTPALDHWLQRYSRELSASFMNSLQGRWLWFWLLAGVIVLMYAGILMAAIANNVEAGWFSITVSYICCFLGGGVALALAWLRVGRSSDVRPGLIANFFLSGAVLGSAFALLLNNTLILGWAQVSPRCSPLNMHLDAGCTLAAELMWVLTPGLVEETFKSVWLFFRLRRGPEDLPSKCCFCLPSTRAHDCGCWYKLAPTPYHVFMCALASGAGFESFENLLYVFDKSDVFRTPHDPAAANMMQVTAFSRVAMSSMHMMWTSLIGLGLARRLFLPEARRPWLIGVLLPSMLLHGTFDFSATALGTVAKEVKDQDLQAKLVLLFFCLMAVVIAISCLLFGVLTGCRGRLICDDGCCCAPGFWEAMFGPQAAEQRVAMAGPASQELQPGSPGALRPAADGDSQAAVVGQPVAVSADHPAGNLQGPLVSGDAVAS